jgi:hypothetical protein
VARHEHIRAWLWTLAVLAIAGGASAAPAVVPFVTPPSGGTPLTLSDLRELAASVGFPDPELAAAVAMAESHIAGSIPPQANPHASNIVTHPLPGNAPERSFGLWQVNTLAHPEFSETSLLDAAYNAHAALLISKSGTDFTPWTQYKNGAYKQYMGGSA